MPIGGHGIKSLKKKKSLTKKLGSALTIIVECLTDYMIRANEQNSNKT